MRSVFVRTWVALAAAVLAVGVATGAWSVAIRDPQDPVRRLLAEGPPTVEDAFATGSSEPEALGRVERALGVEARLDVDPPVPPPARRRLAEGYPVPLPPGGPPGVWVPVGDGRLVRLVAPPPRPPPLPLLVAALVGGMGLAAAWQLRPLDRALARLSAAAERMGTGDLDVRVGLAGDGPAELLGRRFDEMAERIGALLRGRTELLLAVSHELRTPLQRLRLATELLGDDRGTAAERRALAERVERDLDELDALVDELLVYGRLQTTAPAREPVDLDAALAAAADRARDAGATDVRVEGGPPRCLGDGVELRRALGNLAENAARYGRGRVVLTARADGRDLALLVDDDGPGVPPADRERVLEPFVRLDAARTTHRGGVGLGLAIAARVAAAHGGALVVEEAPGLGGARFRLALPGALTNADAG
jgi:signal transduction histidine kinase